MEADTLERIIELARSEVSVEQIDGVPHAAVPLVNVTPKLFAPSTMNVATLAGFVGFIERNADKIAAADVFVHVESPRSVALVSGIKGPRSQRFIYVRAETAPDAPTFGRYLDPEVFTIELTTRYVENDARALAVSLAGNVAAESAVSVEDDGFAQTVGMKKGIALRERAEIVNPFLLAPYRTFREVEQPTSPFLLRMRGGGESAVEVALFEADGGQWKLDAVESIARWLVRELDALTVIA